MSERSREEYEAMQELFSAFDELGEIVGDPNCASDLAKMMAVLEDEAAGDA